MRIAIDIDSTLHDYWGQFARAAKRRFGVDLPYEHQTSWSIDRLRPEQVRACVRETHREERILEASPYPGAVPAVRRWHADGHRILITSHRATECDSATRRWLDAIGLPFDDLHCSDDKIPRCLEYGIELLIDDSPVNLAHALDAGMFVATVRHPWNGDFCDSEAVVCAAGWPELEHMLEPLLAKGRPLGDPAVADSPVDPIPWR